MTQETWRPVPFCPAYEVSDLGRVRRGARILKPWRLKNGRWQIRLHSGNKIVGAFHTYRLVALTFLGPPPFAGAEVAHKNDDKDDNRLTNLKWCSHAENCRDRRRNGKAATGSRNGAYTQPHRRPQGERAGAAKLTAEAVAAIRLSDETQKVLAARYGVTRAAIGYVKRGQTWKMLA